MSAPEELHQRLEDPAEQPGEPDVTTMQRVTSLFQSIKQSFRTLPWNSTAVLLSLLALLFICIALGVSWFVAHDHAEHIESAVYLFSMSMCVEGNRTEYTPGSVCLNIPLSQTPTLLDFFLQAGNTAAVFSFFSLFMLAAGCYWTECMRQSVERLEKSLPQFVLRNQWIRADKAKHYLLLLMIWHAIIAFWLFLAWVCYCGIVNRQMSDEAAAILLHMAPLSASKNESYGAGFALIIVAMFFEIFTILVLKKAGPRIRGAQGYESTEPPTPEHRGSNASMQSALIASENPFVGEAPTPVDSRRPSAVSDAGMHSEDDRYSHSTDPTN